MSLRPRQRLTYANVMSTLAVFLTLVTGTAYASHLVVKSGDVVNNSLVSADLKDGSAVKGSDVVRNSLTGSDVNEATLGRVPRSTIGGKGRFKSMSSSGECDPIVMDYTNCVNVTIQLSTPAKLLLVGRITANPKTEGQKFGECVLGSTSGRVDDTYVNVSFTVPAGLSLLGMTEVFPKGTHTFGIDCRDPHNAGITFSHGRIAAVAISTA